MSPTNTELSDDSALARFYCDVVIDNDAAREEEPDDSPWRPDANVRFDHPAIRRFDGQEPGGGVVGRRSAGGMSPSPLAPPLGPKPVVAGQRLLAGVSVFVLVVVGVFVMVRSGSGVPTGSIEAIAARSLGDAGNRSLVTRDLGGDVTIGPGDVPLLTATDCPSQRLPAVADPLWEVELANARGVLMPLNVSEESVVAVVGFEKLPPDGLPAVSIVVLDTSNGQERWRVEMQPSTGRHEVIAVVDGAVIVRSAAGPDMAYRRLFAFDENSGAVLWERGFRGDWSATADNNAGLVYVGVRRPAASDESEVEVLDPRTGSRVNVVAGAYVGIDPDGRLVSRVSDTMFATSVDDRVLLGVIYPDDSPFALVGQEVVVAGRAESELSALSGAGESRQLSLTGSTGISAPDAVTFLKPLGESALLVSGAGAVHGATVGEDIVEILWRVVGALLDSATTDRGRSLLIGTESGARQRVVDSSTGRTIVNLELRPGVQTVLELVANGVVVPGVVNGTSVRAAVDLDGRELWTLPGTGPLAIGRGVVVDVTHSLVPGADRNGFRLVAYGDLAGVGSGVDDCLNVMTEWISR